MLINRGESAGTPGVHYRHKSCQKVLDHILTTQCDSAVTDVRGLSVNTQTCGSEIVLGVAGRLHRLDNWLRTPSDADGCNPTWLIGHLVAPITDSDRATWGTITAVHDDQGEAAVVLSVHRAAGCNEVIVLEQATLFSEWRVSPVFNESARNSGLLASAATAQVCMCVQPVWLPWPIPCYD